MKQLAIIKDFCDTKLLNMIIFMIKIHHIQSSLYCFRKSGSSLIKVDGSSPDDDNHIESIDIGEKFRLEKSKTQTKAGRKFL